MQPLDQRPELFRARRAKIAARMSGPALLLAGETRGRNYPANIYPFRANSHFLYATGLALPGAALLLHEGRSVLYLVPPADDDALWHGETASHDAIAEAAGVDEVRATTALAADVAALRARSDVAHLPGSDDRARMHADALLGSTYAATTGASHALRDVDLPLADALIAARSVQDEGALADLREASQATAAAFEAGMAATRPGVPESLVRAAMERELLARDMTTAYGAIVTVHGEVLHNTTYGNRCEAGDLLLADVGAEHRGWAADVTRTWPVSATFSATQRAIYEIVLEAELRAINLVRPGVRYRDVHLEACRTLARGLVDEGILVGDVDGLVEQGAHALFFPHGTGHLLGLDVHDMEDLGLRAWYAPGRERSTQFGLCYLRLDRDLEPGMLVTVEPGFYQVPAILDDPQLGGKFTSSGVLNRDALARFADVRGIRIEDDVLCTQADPDVLTQAIPKRVDELERARG